MPLYSRYIDSPLGAILLVATDHALVRVGLPTQRPAHRVEVIKAASHPVLDRAADELGAYFQGERTGFSIPLAQAGTPFQRSVWTALLTIPFGERRSYSWLARNIGRPRAVRAVGSANGRNGLPIVVPCHRVVHKDGSLAGYAGGVEVKRWLLDHEHAAAGRGETASP
jgi:methylated-DNA-[protein]-cysteine S-methyltransferase